MGGFLARWLFDGLHMARWLLSGGFLQGVFDQIIEFWCVLCFFFSQPALQMSEPKLKESIVFCNNFNGFAENFVFSTLKGNQLYVSDY